MRGVFLGTILILQSFSGNFANVNTVNQYGGYGGYSYGGNPYGQQQSYGPPSYDPYQHQQQQHQQYYQPEPNYYGGGQSYGYQQHYPEPDYGYGGNQQYGEQGGEVLALKFTLNQDTFIVDPFIPPPFPQCEAQDDSKIWDRCTTRPVDVFDECDGGEKRIGTVSVFCDSFCSGFMDQVTITGPVDAADCEYRFNLKDGSFTVSAATQTSGDAPLIPDIDPAECPPGQTLNRAHSFFIDEPKFSKESGKYEYMTSSDVTFNAEIVVDQEASILPDMPVFTQKVFMVISFEGNVQPHGYGQSYGYGQHQQYGGGYGNYGSVGPQWQYGQPQQYGNYYQQQQQQPSYYGGGGGMNGWLLEKDDEIDAKTKAEE